MYTVPIAQYGRDRLPAMAMYSAATAASRGGGRGGTGLPTATQHQEQVDLVARHLRFGRGQGGIAGGQAAVGIQAGQVRRAAALVQPAGLSCA
ncbi:hypothetical protein G6F32_015405 [Rhizopus arrhizus]|nr:hypothetical protein G6F32_015405 [Rhizopus arrhizus]